MWSLLCLCCSCKVKWSAWKPIRIGRQRTCSKSLLHIKVIYDVAVEARLIPLSLNCRCQALWWAIISPECLNLFHWAAAAVLADVYLRHRNVTVGAKLASKKWYKHSKWISEFVSFGHAIEERMMIAPCVCVCDKQGRAAGPSTLVRFLIFLSFPVGRSLALMNFLLFIFCALAQCDVGGKEWWWWKKKREEKEDGDKNYLCQNVGILLGFSWMANMALAFLVPQREGSSRWSVKWSGELAEVQGLTALVTV